MRHGRPWPWVILVAAFAFALVTPVLTSGTFINDRDSILRIPLVSTWRNVPTIFSQNFMIFTEGQFRPMSYALLAVVRTWVPAEGTTFWHAWLAGFHALNSVLVFLVAAHVARKLPAALAAGALFAAHPMIALFANHMNAFPYVLAGTFYLATLACYLSFVRSRRLSTYVLGVLLFVCGLLTSKLLLTLPVFLLLYEFFYERDRPAAVLKRFLPLAACCLALAPCWLWLRPHPLFYRYAAFPAGSEWFSLYTFLGRTWRHVVAIVGGWGFEAPLHETTVRTFAVTPEVLFWGVLGVLAFVLSAVLLWHRQWGGLSLPLAMLSVTPFATVLFHHSRDFISWHYLYLVVAAFALGVGALAEGVARVKTRWLRTLGVCAAVVLIGIYGGMLIRAEFRTKSPETYWRYVLRVNPESGVASYELGKTALAEGDVDAALRFLFAPRVKSVYDSALLMMDHYAEDNEPLAAALHFNSAPFVQPDDMHAQNDLFMTAVRLVYEPKVLDYVEQGMAQVLMTNPYHTRAMRMMARALADKGRVRAACMYLERARKIDPGDTQTVRLLEAIRKRLYTPAPKETLLVPPPDYDWLEHLIRSKTNEPIRQRILRLARKYPADPVIQFQAATVLLDAGKTALATPKIEMAAARMPRHPSVRELVKRLAAVTQARTGEGAGDATLLNHWGYTLLQRNNLEGAAVQFHAALKVDPKNADAHNNLALVFRLQGKHNLALKHYRKVVELDPKDPESYRGLAGELKSLAKYAECLKVLEDGLRAVPVDPELKLRLSWLLSTVPVAHLRSGRRAVVLAEAAGRAGGAPDPAQLSILAAAYAETGEFDRAVETARKAAALAREMNDAALEKTLAERVRLYRRRQPYRLPKPTVSP